MFNVFTSLMLELHLLIINLDIKQPFSMDLIIITIYGIYIWAER